MVPKDEKSGTFTSMYSNTTRIYRNTNRKTPLIFLPCDKRPELHHKNFVYFGQGLSAYAKASVGNAQSPPRLDGGQLIQATGEFSTGKTAFVFSCSAAILSQVFKTPADLCLIIDLYASALFSIKCHESNASRKVITVATVKLT